MFINDEHEQDTQAVTTLIEMLHSRKFPASLLLFPAVPHHLVDVKKKKKPPSAIKETAATASLEGDEDEDEWDTEDDEARAPTPTQVKACVRREFTEYLGRKKEVLVFIRGDSPLRGAFEPTASPYEEGSREFELGEIISEAFYADLVKGSLDLMKLQDHTFEAFCKVVHKLAAEGFRAQVKTTKRHMQKALTTKAKSKSHLMKTAKKKILTTAQRLPILDLDTTQTTKKKAAPVKVEQPAYDNSHNHGFRGRINQRTIDSMQGKKIAPGWGIKKDLKDEEW